jgi:hypothetical protein
MKTKIPRCPCDLPAVARKKVSAAFLGGRITSDGGVMLLAQAAADGFHVDCAVFVSQMRCSPSLKDPVQASVTCLAGATSGSIPDIVRPRPAFGCDVVSCRTGRVRRHWGCHLYFARRMSFLPCADIDSRARQCQIYCHG